MKNRNRAAWLALSLLCAPALGAPAGAPAATPWNPKPLEGDQVLPMPGGAEAVFRAVTVSDRSLKNRRAGLGSKTYAGICRAMVSTPPVFPEASASTQLR